MKSLLTILFATMLCGCSQSSLWKYSQEEEQYMYMLNLQPVIFTLGDSVATLAWIRAKEFVGTYTTSGSFSITDTLLKSYFEGTKNVEFGYQVKRKKNITSTTFEVWCIRENTFSKIDAINNSKILAHYMQTGELPFPRLIAK